MLYDALITLDLPQQVGPPLPTGLWDGLERLLFTGSWSRRAATCTLSSAAVLAGCHAALRALPPDGPPTLQVVDDAGELLDLSASPDRWGAEPARWAEILPPRWTDEPCAFRLRASFEEGGFAVVVLLRHTPRHDLEHAALGGALRVLWAPESADERLTRRVVGAGTRLARLLQLEGDRLVAALTDALRARFGAEPSHRGQVVVPIGDARGFGDLLQGFPERATAALAPIADTLEGWWPALAADGVEGRWREGEFVPTAEVAHVV
jgi:hypothetical protein